MNVTPASVKIRRWFVAGVAAVMAIAWTVSSLVTPGSADVSGNSVPGQNASIGQATSAGGVSVPKVYQVKKSYSPVDAIRTGVGFIELTKYKMVLKKANGKTYATGSGVGYSELTGDDGKPYTAICIDPLGADPGMKSKGGQLRPDEFKNHPRAVETPGFDRELMLKKLIYLWESDFKTQNWDNIYRKTGVSKLDLDTQNTAAAAWAIHFVFWKLDGKLDFANSQIVTRLAGVGGATLPAPNVDDKVRELATKMWEMAENVELPASMVGVAGAEPGSSVGNAGFDANGNFVVNYELTGPANANGKEATLSITTAGQPGLPEGATLVDNATARELKNGSKVTLPASVTLTLPGKVANAYQKVEIQATTSDSQTAPAITRVPIDITGQAGKQVNVTVQGLPSGAKLTYADGTEFINGSVVDVPTRLYASLPSGTQGVLKVNLSNPSGNAAKAAVSVMEQTRSVDTNGDMYVQIGVSGYSDSGKATMSVSNLPSGVTLVDQNGAAITNGSMVELPSTLTLKVPAGTQAGSVNIGAATSAKTGSVLGTVLKPPHPSLQWTAIIEAPPGADSNANAQIGIKWTPRPTPPETGSFTLTKRVTGSDDAEHDYVFNVDCTDEAGQPLGTKQVTLKKDGSTELSGYTVGTKCVVTEDEASQQFEGNEPEFKGVTFSGGQGAKHNEVTIKGSASGAVEIVATNTYQPAPNKGHFQVRKGYEVNSSYKDKTREFIINVECSKDGVPVGSERLSVSQEHPQMTKDYEVGTECVVTEDTEQADTVPGHRFKAVRYPTGPGFVVKGNNRVVVTIAAPKYSHLDGKESIVFVEACNEYEKIESEGNFKIQKVVEGVEPAPTNEFSFTAKCDDGSTETHVVRAGETVDFSNHKEGTICTVEETESSAQIDGYTFSSVAYSGGNVDGKPNQVQITAGESATLVLTATNTYEKKQGTFSIVKTFAADSTFKGDASHSYSFDVVCGGDTVEGVTVSKETGWKWTSESMPVGTECTVSEDTASAHVDGHSFKGVTLTSSAGTVAQNKATFTIADNAEVRVTAQNEYAQPTLQTNASISEGNKLEKGHATQLKDKVTFTNLEKGKTYTVGGYFIDKATSKAVTGFYTKTFTSADLKGTVENNGLVSGYLELTDKAWTVTPSSNGQAFVAFEYLWEGEQPTTPEVPTNPGTDKVTPKPDVEHENPEDPNQTVSSEEKGSFTIEKKLAGDAAGKVVEDAVFPFVVDCGAERIENVTLNQKFTSEELPVGTECTVTEKDAPVHFEGATLSKVAYTLDGADIVGDSVSFTIKKGDTPQVAVVATNTYDVPTVTTDAEPEAPAVEAQDVTVVDKVSYTNLIAGKEYTVQGQLHYQEGDAPSATDGDVVKGVTPGNGCTVDGKAVEGKDCAVGDQPDSVSYTFIAPGKEGELVSGYVDLVFNVPASAVQSKPMVVFEDVYYDGKKVAGHHDINDENQTVPVSEKVSFPIKKILTGDGASQAHGTYNFVATCAKEGETGEEQRVSVVVSEGTEATSSEMITAHVGETCTITEAQPNLGAGLTSTVSFADSGISGVTGGETLTVNVTKENKATIAEEGFAFEATNTVTTKKAKFSVTKTDATAQGHVTIPDTFTFEYVCGATTGTLDVAKGEVKEGPELPLGTQCTIKEKGAGVANAHLATAWTVNGASTTANEDGAVQITLSDEDQVVAVGATNTYTEKTGKFTLAKKVSTSSTTQSLDGQTYKFTYKCVDSKDQVVASSEAPIEAVANGGPVTIASIPVGARCSVEELTDALPAAPHADMNLSWEVNNQRVDGNKATFTINDEVSAVNVVATNSYTDITSGFQVKKQVSGDASSKPTEFTFDYVCGEAKGEFTISEKKGFNSNDDAKLKDVKPGTQCTLTEHNPSTDAHAQWAVTYDKSGNEAGVNWTDDTKNNAVSFTVPTGDTALIITAHNEFTQKRGKINVTKVVENNGVAGLDSSYTFGIACTFDGQARSIEPATHTVKPGATASWDNLPVGAQCNVTEIAASTPKNASHVLAWKVDGLHKGNDSSVSVEVPEGEAGVTVEATNTYEPKEAGFSVEKKSVKVTPAGATLENAPTEFHFAYRCGADNEWKSIESALKVGGPKATVDGLVAGERCELKENSDGMKSRIVKWTVDGAKPVEGDTVAFTLDADRTLAILVDNEYPTTPKIGTELTDQAGNHNVKSVGDKVILKDVVKYYNLDTTKTYQASGTLMAWDNEGNVINTGIEGKSEEFTPSSPNGEIVVNFKISSSELDKFAKVVAYEKLLLNGEVIATHEDPDDENQVVKVYPSIKTTLTGADKEAKTYDRPTDPNAEVTLIDTVEYKNLRVGTTYMITGELYGDNGLTGIKGHSEPFTATAPEDDPDAEFVSGSVDIEFKVSGSVLQANSKLVAFEKLWDTTKVTPPANPGDENPTPDTPQEPDAKHEDPDDPNQTVKRNPSIATSASAKDGEGKQTKVVKLSGEGATKVEITDNLSWWDLPAGDYVAIARVVDNNGQSVDGGDTATNGVKEFTVPDNEQQGVVDVPISVTIDGKTSPSKIVVYEYVYKKGDVDNGRPKEDATPVAKHEDPSDANQTITTTPDKPASVETNLTVKKTLGEIPGGKQLPQDTLYGFEFSCKDTDVIRFTLKANEAATDNWPADLQGKECTIVEQGPVEGAYSEANGWKPLQIEGLQWSDVVWTEDGKEKRSVNEAADTATTKPQSASYTFVIPEPEAGETGSKAIEVVAQNYFTEPKEDKPETPTPTLSTSAEDMRADGPGHPDRSVRSGSIAMIEDTVTFTNLQVGKKYMIKGQIMDKDTESALTSVGLTDKNECAIIQGETRQKIECNDEGNGVISMTFTLTGEADAYVDGKAKMQFKVPAADVKKDAQYVVFEELFTVGENGTESIVKHHDFNDNDQTITANGCNEIPPNNPPTPDLPENPGTPPDLPEGNCPTVSTTLSVDGPAEDAVRGKDHTMTDSIHYVDLLPNKEYKMLGRLHVGGDESANGVITTVTPGTKCFADGKPATCKDEGNGFVSITFTTGVGNNKRGYVDGTVDMQFVVPAAVLETTDKVVAFETAYDEAGYMVAWHHDINSKEQTKLVREPDLPETPTGHTPPTKVTPPPSTVVRNFLAKTGAGTFTLLVLGLMGLIGGGVLVWASPARRRREDTE